MDKPLEIALYVCLLLSIVLVALILGALIGRRETNGKKVQPETEYRIVARWVLHAAFEAWAEEGWEQIPDVGENDYERIVETAEGMLPPDVSREDYEMAMVWFETRAGMRA